MDTKDLEAARVALDHDLDGLANGAQFRDQLLRLAVEYHRMRTDWALSSPSERTEIDAVRTRSHDAFISTLNAITRRLAAQGAELAWRNKFSLAGEGAERKQIGDFACYLTFAFAMTAR